jgi:hypothetical protein
MTRNVLLHWAGSRIGRETAAQLLRLSLYPITSRPALDGS